LLSILPDLIDSLLLVEYLPSKDDFIEEKEEKNEDANDEDNNCETNIEKLDTTL